MLYSYFTVTQGSDPDSFCRRKCSKASALPVHCHTSLAHVSPFPRRDLRFMAPCLNHKPGVFNPPPSSELLWTWQNIFFSECWGCCHEQTTSSDLWHGTALTTTVTFAHCNTQIFCEIHSTCREAKLSPSIHHGQLSEKSISNMNISSSLNNTLWEDIKYAAARLSPRCDSKFW